MSSKDLFSFNIEKSILISLKNKGLISEQELAEAETELRKLYESKNKKSA